LFTGCLGRYVTAYEHIGTTFQPLARAVSSAARVRSAATPRPPIASGTSVCVIVIVLPP
jgi:hypothetical protein